MKSGGKWEEYTIERLFSIQTPKKKFNANKLTFNGNYPYVARGSNNNGIKGYIDEDELYLNPGNTISFGQDTATMFYQENAYFTGDKIKIFSLRHGELNSRIAVFLISAMKKSFSTFSWGSSSFNENVLNKVKINIPTFNNVPAYNYMVKYIEELEAAHIEELEAYLLVSGLADSRTRGLADSRTRGLADSRTRGHQHNVSRRQRLLVSGLADSRTRGLADSRTRGLADSRTRGLADSRTRGLAD
ncbi:restriction endonuclease subunit S [Escherichia coli]|nr:restriction endonuclease subunit S [Escherichia coli]MCW3306559.1 restriction endonuclease subunit S [Escherichia coli]